MNHSRNVFNEELVRYLTDEDNAYSLGYFCAYDGLTKQFGDDIVKPIAELIKLRVDWRSVESFLKSKYVPKSMKKDVQLPSHANLMLVPSTVGTAILFELVSLVVLLPLA